VAEMIQCAAIGFAAGLAAFVVQTALASLYRNRRRRLDCKLVEFQIGGPDMADNRIAARKLIRAWERIVSGKD